MRRDNKPIASGVSIGKAECTTMTMVIYCCLNSIQIQNLRSGSDKVVICGTLSRPDYRNDLHSLNKSITPIIHSIAVY